MPSCFAGPPHANGDHANGDHANGDHTYVRPPSVAFFQPARFGLALTCQTTPALTRRPIPWLATSKPSQQLTRPSNLAATQNSTPARRPAPRHAVQHVSRVALKPLDLRVRIPCDSRLLKRSRLLGVREGFRNLLSPPETDPEQQREPYTTSSSVPNTTQKFTTVVEFPSVFMPIRSSHTEIRHLQGAFLSQKSGVCPTHKFCSNPTRPSQTREPFTSQHGLSWRARASSARAPPNRTKPGIKTTRQLSFR